MIHYIEFAVSVRFGLTTCDITNLATVAKNLNSEALFSNEPPVRENYSAITSRTRHPITCSWRSLVFGRKGIQIIYTYERVATKKHSEKRIINSPFHPTRRPGLGAGV